MITSEVDVCPMCEGPAVLIALIPGHATTRCRACGWTAVTEVDDRHVIGGHLWVGEECADPLDIELGGDPRQTLADIAAEVGLPGDRWTWQSGDVTLSGRVA